MHNAANTTIGRAGQTGVAQGTEQSHTLVVLVHDRPGSVDRVIGLFRRRRANMQTLVLSRGMQAQEVRITTSVNDSEVGVEHLVEQLRKIVDVTQVTNLTAHEAIMRELALIKMNTAGTQAQEALAHAQSCGAQRVDETKETVTLQIVESTENIEQLLERLRPYGIREIVRSGSVAISRIS